MRWTIFLALLASSGCTHIFLKENTLRTASSLSRLQTEQVLDNLALLSRYPDANPWHLNLTSGLIQATDQGTGTVLGNLFAGGPAGMNGFTPSLTALRGLVEQWSVNPVTDGEQIETLRVAYRKALNPLDPEIDDAIVDQIVGLCVRFSLLPQKETIESILKPKKGAPHKEAYLVCYALNAEIQKLGEKLRWVRVYASKSEKQNRADVFELHMQIFNLEEKIELRESQRDLLRELAGIPPPKGEKPMKDGEQVPAISTPEEEEFMKADKKPSRRVARKPALGSRRSPRSVTPADSSDTTLLILSAIQAKAPPGYLPPTDTLWESTRNPALVDQAEDQIGRLEDLLYKKPEYQSPWVFFGPKKAVPRDACCVGCFKDKHGEWCAWVMPEQYAILQNFTQLILSLAATPPQDIPPISAAFSPALR